MIVHLRYDDVIADYSFARAQAISRQGKRRTKKAPWGAFAQKLNAAN